MTGPPFSYRYRCNRGNRMSNHCLTNCMYCASDERIFMRGSIVFSQYGRPPCLAMRSNHNLIINRSDDRIEKQFRKNKCKWLLTLSRSAHMYGPGRRMTSRSCFWAKSMNLNRLASPSKSYVPLAGSCRDHSMYVSTVLSPAALYLTSRSSQYCDGTRK